MTEQVVKLGAVGTGGIWGAHARNLEHIGGNQVVAVCDISDANRDKWAAELGARPYADVNEMLAQEELDAVVVCTPPTARLAVVQAAAPRRVPVFMEKPPAFTVEDAAAIARVVEQSGVPVFVGFMYRTLPAVARLRELIAGRPVNLVQSSFFCPAATAWNLPGWFYLKEHSGGHVVDQAIHSIDLLRYLAGDITQVHTLGNNVIRPKDAAFTIEDSSSTNLRFASGASGGHLHSWAHQEFTGAVAVVGIDYHLTIELDYHLHGFVDQTPIDETFPAPPDGCTHHYDEMAAFLHTARTGDFSTMRSPFADAALSLATVVAMNESIATGQPVDVPRQL